MFKSYFAPPERSSKKELVSEISIVSQNPVVSGLLHSVSGLLAVLNEHRQILAVNDSFLKMLGLSNPIEALGLRPGEAVRCVHAHEEPGGCGTSKFCPTCGAVIAMLASLGQDRPEERSCALTLEREGQTVDMVLLVKSRPITIEGVKFLLLFLQDITLQQQRAALERTFFHDINNMLNGLVGASELLTMGKHPEKLGKMILQASLQLSKEVEIQKCLSRSGTGYNLRREQVSTNKIQEDLRAFFFDHPIAQYKHIEFLPADLPVEIITDPSLVLRILKNMITNALEAGKDSNPVKVWFERDDDVLTFCVWNREEIPGDITLRVFQRNFSTKTGDGRGLGTHAMKLFGEHCLGGKVGFTTSVDAGTTFRLSLPRRDSFCLLTERRGGSVARQ
jgi:signal transduction histidine kinase